jgi:HEAT repeat protein
VRGRREIPQHAGVGRDKTVPLEVLSQLAGDSDPSVRRAVADKRKLTPELFEALSTDQDALVRLRVAYNKKTPSEVIERLVSDEDPLVRGAAVEVLERRRKAQPQLPGSER